MAVNPYAAPSADLDSGIAGAQAQPAGRGARFAAALLDSLFVGVAYGIGAGIGAATDSPGIAVALVVVLLLGLVGYNIMLLSSTGQSLGKKLMGIKITKRDGHPVTFGTAVMMRIVVGQMLLGIIPLYGLVDVLFIFRDDRRCIHDMVADTIVVSAN